MHKRGMTLVEIVTVIAVIGVGIGIFYTTFLQNWWAFDDQLTRINLWQDANEITRLFTDDARASRQLAVATTTDVSTATLTLPDGSSVVYSMRANGIFEITRAGATAILSQNVDFNNSSFEQVGNSLRLVLTLNDDILFGRRVAVTTSTQAFSRCIACTS